VTHHASNGCNLRFALMASGTVSGAETESWGSLMEITSCGVQAIKLPADSPTRTVLGMRNDQRQRHTR
jgi:hypothetical protein